MTLESGHHVVLIARNNAGYSNLCRLISAAQLANSKGKARLPFDALAEHSSDLLCLSGCREGEVASNLLAGRYPEALAAAWRYLEVFGRDAFWIELQHHWRPDDTWLCAALARLADKLGIGCVATNDVHYAVPTRRRLQDVLVCIRTRTNLDQSHPLRKPNAEYRLKSGPEMAELFRHYPKAVENAGRLAEECSVDLHLGAYRFPAFDLPPGEIAFNYLYQLCHQGAQERYRPLTPQVLGQLAHELAVIEKLGLSEYFLIVWDVVRFARERGILAQGRGSAANSVVAYCLDITNVDPIKLGLLFERFLSEERAGAPDIDVDFANSRREEVIQYVYQKYGADHTAMVCTVEGRAVRLGYRYARGIGEAALVRLSTAAEAGPYASLEDFCRRTGLEREAVENLIAVGAFDGLGVPRRQLLWQLPEALQAAWTCELPGLQVLSHQVDLPPLAPIEEARSDYFVLGLSTACHVMDFYRPRLAGRHVLRSDELRHLPSGCWVRVAGVVICRQALPTAHGHVFLTLEDETGLCSVTVRPNVYQTCRQAVRHDLVLLVEGVLQSQDGVASVLVRRPEGLRLDDLEPPLAREFR